MEQKNLRSLMEKWAPVLDTDATKAPIIESDYKRRVTTQLLENTQVSLNEAAQTTVGNMANFDPILISLVRRLAPKLIAYDVCGVQPMQMPTGLIFALRARYSSKNGAEALFQEADSDFSGAGTHAGTDPFDVGYTHGTGKATADAESGAWNPMSMTIEKKSVVAMDRNLRADYSLQLQQDLKTVHGLDADAELTNILSAELLNEINREIVRTIYTISRQGAQFATAPGTFGLTADSDGRWSVERYKGLMYAIERDANAVAVETRRGKGNIIITSADVASALVMAGLLSFNNPAFISQTQLEVDVTGTTYAGMLGRFKVFVDPYAGGNGYVVGYKGANAYDAGLFYAPYVPLQLVRATNVDSFQPAIGFITRYGIVENPFTTLNPGDNVYYRKAKIVGL